MNESLRQFSELTELNNYRLSLIQKRGTDVSAPLALFLELKTKLKNRTLFNVLSHEYVHNAIVADQLHDLCRMLEVMALPYCDELQEVEWMLFSDTLNTLYLKSEQQGFTDTPFTARYTLSSNTELVALAVAELRLILAIFAVADSYDDIHPLVSASGRSKMLVLNTPLHILMNERLEDTDSIVSLVRNHKVLDGNRIKEMLDVGHQTLSDGVL